MKGARDLIYCCRLPGVLIIKIFVMSLLMLSDLTSMLGLCMLVFEIVMIYILVLI
jgi:hypothetical protein